MAWALVGDEFHGHPKVAVLLADPDGAAAIGLWVLALSWARHYNTGGVVPVAQLERLIPGGGVGGLLALLMGCGLWEWSTPPQGGTQDLFAIGKPMANAIRFHDWDEVYRDEAKARALSEKRSKAGKAGAAALWQKDGKNGNLDPTPTPTPDPTPLEPPILPARAPLLDPRTAAEAREHAAEVLMQAPSLARLLADEWERRTGVLMVDTYQLSLLLERYAAAKALVAADLVPALVAACVKLAATMSPGKRVSMAPIKFCDDRHWAAVQEIMHGTRDPAADPGARGTGMRPPRPAVDETKEGKW